jgi:hypothetical protein
MQHFKVKLFATAATQGAHVHDAIAVFHRWIQEKSIAETLIDVSDYLHVPQGPGIILVSHESIHSLDTENGRLGLTYTRRTALDGSIEDRLRQAVNAVLHAAGLIEASPEFSGKLAFERAQWEVSVNDRLLAPNTPETFAALKPALATVFPGKSFTHIGEPRQLLRVAVQ